MLDRRALLTAVMLPLAAPHARADTPLTGAEILLVAMSDLHSAQEGAAAALGVVGAALAANRGVPAAILINGDVFERGNAIALRSAGVADWALLGALRRLAPVVLNLGNHEGALIDDMAEVVRRAQAIDLVVVSTMRDRRSGQALAPAHADLALGGRTLRIVGIATDAMATYRPPVRALLDIPAPAAWAAANLPALLEGNVARVVMSHAGVMADRAMLPLLPDGTLLLGGHEHLRFVHAEGTTRYVHTGSWQRFITLVGLRSGHAPVLREVAVEPGGPADAAHQALWREVHAAHATPADREVVMRLPAGLPLGDAARRAAAAIAEATGAASGLIAHTSFGTGLPAGEVTRLAFDAFLRFDGPLQAAEADAAALAAVAARANQDDARPLAARSGDFVYAHPARTAAPARLAASDWVARNAATYLGVETLRFATVPELRIKPVVEAALRRAT